MTKLNKIVQVMVIAGVAQISMGAFAAETSVSQSSNASNETNVSQSTNAESGQNSMTMNSDSSATSFTKVDADTDNTSMSDSEESIENKRNSDGSIESGSSVESDNSADNDDSDDKTEEKPSTNSVDMSYLVKVDTVQTATIETLDTLSEVGNNLVTGTSNSFEGQLTSVSSLANNTTVDSASRLSADNAMLYS
jgi:hypothetical protein